MKTLAMAALTALTLLAAAPAPSPPAVTVHIEDFAFVPARLTVDAGTSVRFVNDDNRDLSLFNQIICEELANLHPSMAA